MPQSPMRLCFLVLLVAAWTPRTTQASPATSPSAPSGSDAAPAEVMSPGSAGDGSVGDPIAGAALAQQCAGCHLLERGGKERWGPDLFGIDGRPMGADPEYRYASYLRGRYAAGATWDEAALREWLVDSKAVAKAAGARTKMPAQELAADELDDLLSYLRTLK